MMTVGTLLPTTTVTSLVRQWLAEDMPTFDYGGHVVGDQPSEAILWAKAPGVLAGVPFVDAVFQELDCRVEWRLREGQTFLMDGSETLPGDRVEVARVRGAARQLLAGERVALNLLARAGGIATRAYRLARLRERKQWTGVLAGTRKTTPGFRLVEKYAMLVGGVDTHRMDLSSMIMLKDNHVWSTGSITNAVREARRVGGFALKIEVECRSWAEAVEACQAGAEIVMLDNFEPASLHNTAGQLKQQFPHVLIEGSGGLTEDNVEAYMSNNVDVLSFGSLSQSVPHVDFSLKIQQRDVSAGTA